MNDDYKAIRMHVKAYVKASGTTMDALAAELGIGRSAFYDRLAGRVDWYFQEVKQLAQILGMTIDELATCC